VGKCFYSVVLAYRQIGKNARQHFPHNSEQRESTLELY